MNRKSTFKNKPTHTRPPRKKWGPSLLAGRMLMVGLPLILAGTCDFAARLYASGQAGEVGFMIRMGDAGAAILAALAILLGGALLMEHMEQVDLRKKQK